MWSTYFQQRREHEEALAALTGEAPPEDPFLALERKLAEVRLGSVAAAAGLCPQLDLAWWWLLLPWSGW